MEPNGTTTTYEPRTSQVQQLVVRRLCRQRPENCRQPEGAHHRQTSAQADYAGCRRVRAVPGPSPAGPRSPGPGNGRGPHRRADASKVGSGEGRPRGSVPQPGRVCRLVAEDPATKGPGRTLRAPRPAPVEA